VNDTDIIALFLGRTLIGAGYWICLFYFCYGIYRGGKAVYQFIVRRFRKGKEDSLVVSFRAYREMIAAIHAVPVEEYAYYDHENKRAVRKSEIRPEKHLAAVGGTPDPILDRGEPA
jgi:hypothetical protein